MYITEECFCVEGRGMNIQPYWIWTDDDHIHIYIPIVQPGRSTVKSAKNKVLPNPPSTTTKPSTIHP